MAKLELLMLMLPVVFMIHEYEEIVMFRSWLCRNKAELQRRFPKIEAFLARQGHFDYSTATFALGTAHEFVLISVVCFCAVWLGAYRWWFAALMGHSLHLVVHIVQWAIYQKYIPVIFTSILTLPYCIYALVEFSKASLLSPMQMCLWAAIGACLAAASLLPAFFVMAKFHHIHAKRESTV